MNGKRCDSVPELPRTGNELLITKNKSSGDIFALARKTSKAVEKAKIIKKADKKIIKRKEMPPDRKELGVLAYHMKKKRERYLVIFGNTLYNLATDAKPWKKK